MPIIWGFWMRFEDAGRRWRVRSGVPVGGKPGVAVVDQIVIDGETVLRREHVGDDVLAIRTRAVAFRHDGHDYRPEIGPISLWRSGVHLYRDGQLVYRHRDRDFVELPRCEALFAYLDRLDGEEDDDPRAWWKDYAEILLIGGAAGIGAGLTEHWLSRRGIEPPVDIGTAMIVLVVLFAVFRPKSWRFIR